MRVGATFGNLSFPSSELSDFAESVWPGTSRRLLAYFMSSGPALLEEAQGSEREPSAWTPAPARCVTIKLACDRLREDTADAMLAGAVNRADDIHVGFSALKLYHRARAALPRRGRWAGSRRGAGFVVLKRLADAERDGDTTRGHPRVGLSGDGRQDVAPAADGQARALRLAYEEAG